MTTSLESGCMTHLDGSLLDVLARQPHAEGDPALRAGSNPIVVFSATATSRAWFSRWMPS